MEPVICFATYSDIDSLINIWKICFGDEESYIRNFINHCFNPDYTVVAKMSEKVVGVIYMLPAKLGEEKFMYGYAIGVLPEYRGNNICEKMHAFVRKYTNKNEWLYGLHPGNEKLYSYYRKTGLKDMYALRVYEESKTAEKKNFEIEDIDTEGLYQMREKAFSPAVLWSVEMLRYISTEIKQYGGFIKKIVIDEKERLIIGYMHDKTVIVKETTMTDEEIQNCSGGLCIYFGAEKIQYLLPENSTLGKKKIQILGFGDRREDVYMNLFMD